VQAIGGMVNAFQVADKGASDLGFALAGDVDFR